MSVILGIKVHQLLDLQCLFILFCFRYHDSKSKQEISWNDANERCALYDATLPIVNSFEDVEMVFDRLRVYDQAVRRTDPYVQDGYAVIQFAIFLHKQAVNVRSISVSPLYDKHDYLPLLRFLLPNSQHFQTYPP